MNLMMVSIHHSYTGATGLIGSTPGSFKHSKSTVTRVSYRIFVWEGEIFFKDGKPKLNHALNA